MSKNNNRKSLFIGDFKIGQNEDDYMNIAKQNEVNFKTNKFYTLFVIE